MYPVSAAYQLAVKDPVLIYTVTGTIGNQAFDENSIIEGSFRISNQCTDSNDMKLGSVYTATLEATFTGIAIARQEWVGKVINFGVSLKLRNGTYESVPFQPFIIREAKHSADGVHVVAYDYMIKLDKKFKKSHFQFEGGWWGFVDEIEADTGIVVGMTDEEIEALPNGQESVELVGSNGKLKDFATDIETYRDLVSWMAQTLGSFATINRSGQLIFVPFQNENNNVDTISDEHRIEGAVFDDFVTNYNGIYVTNTETGDETYYGYDAATLTAELTTAEATRTSIMNQLDQLEYDYEHGTITEEQYKAQKKVLKKQLSNINKRIKWLTKAISHASDEGGNYMDLGENPFMQENSTPATINTLRYGVLDAVCNISYTPFTCETVFGIHYDLGDILRFEGGHAGEDGVSCCLMAFDWTLNGVYQMQGFGVDPAVPMIKSKSEKSTKAANQNAVNALNNSGEGGGTSYVTRLYRPLELVSYTELS